jgi:DNA-binding response OmpR family regulator
MDAVKTVLIIDDEPDLLKTISFRVKKAGYQVIAAGDGREGLDKAKNDAPDLIILDWKLPVMDGAEVYRALKSDADTKGIPVLFLTASRESETIIHDLGAADVMIKPYKHEELIGKIGELIERASSL